jgi:hypothetical protein
MVNSDNLIYLVILIVIIVVIYYHFNYKNHLHGYKNTLEGYKNYKKFKNNNFIIGNNNTNNIIGNPILPMESNQIELYRTQGDFNKNNSVNSISQHEKLYLDNNLDGLVLLTQGFIIVNYPDKKQLHALIIKGMNKCRVEYNKDGSNNYKPLFNGELRDPLAFNSFTKNSINQKLGNNIEDNIEIKSLKITNIDNKNTNLIKLELLEEVNNKNLDINQKSNQISNLKIVHPKNLDIKSKYIINKDNNKLSYIELKLPDKHIISGFSMKTNVPKFRISTSSNDFETYPKHGHYEGGKMGIKNRDYYLNNTVKTDTIKIIPFINPELFLNNENVSFFISDIKIFKSNKLQNIEGFKIEEPELLSDLKQSIEIDQACEVLKRQETINSEQTKVEEFKKYNLKLEQQKEEFEKLNKEINQLREKRKKQMEKEDMINIAKYQKQREAESKIKDEATKKNSNSFNPTFNLNMIKKTT